MENELENQKIIDEFVHREVLCDVTDMVEFILNSTEDCVPFTYDDVVHQEAVVCEECGMSEFAPISADDPRVTIKENKDASSYERFICPTCGASFETEADARDCCIDIPLMRCINCGHVISIDEYDEMLDIEYADLEWWKVTSWMLKKLRDHGEIVIENENLWGRHYKRGSNVSKESVVRDICHEIEILCGQRFDWSKVNGQ